MILDIRTFRPPIPKKLNFQKSPIINSLSRSTVEIKVSSHCEEQLKTHNETFINTPIKRQILKEGISKKLSENVLGRGGFGKVIKASYAGQIGSNYFHFVYDKNILLYRLDSNFEI